MKIAPVKKRRSYGRAADGTAIVSVTTVIGGSLGWAKDGLMFWAAEKAARKALELTAANMSDDERIRIAKLAHVVERDKAADAGKAAHAMVEAFLRGEDPDDAVDAFLDGALVARARDAFGKFAAWWPTSGYEVVLNEEAFVDRATGYGGTCDLILRHKPTGELVVADNKTGKHIHPEVVLQLGAYALLARLHGHAVRRGLVIHIPSEGEPAFVDVPSHTLEAGACAFAALYVVHKSKNLVKLEKAVA